ncbi:MAG: zinc-dependent metalloprotease [Sediminicola sp.]|tara:strand:+ start:161296 stop:163866 length:2571 start_codon:yes stop_codon:yes gene_type:complete
MRLFLGLFCILLLTNSCALLGLRDKPKKELEKDDEFTVTEIEPYEKIITKEAVTQSGLFKVHKVDDKFYLELHDSILKQEILVISRFIKTPAGAGNYGGEAISEKTIFWERGPYNKIFLRISTLVSKADEEDAISKAVQNSSITPILESFDIEARNQADNASVIEITNFINGENPLLALNPDQKESYGLSTLEKDKSYIGSINAYPINVEIKTVKTYKALTSKMGKKNSLPAATLSGVVTLELNNSFILLPKKPMKRRIFDPRIGYFASSYLQYGDDQQQVDRNVHIHRWRLEPRPEDMEKWRKGELVDPIKPIVYYIDPATPKKWRPYLIAGINDWQKAFEQAGFKNAIVGLEWPENDETMSLEDARFSVLRYFASPVKNAYGPNTSDPRTGEIIQSDIGWYHNLMNLLHNWYLIQAGAVDENARKMEFDDELMGNLIRFVSSHEVGHTLGLRHNMGASHATPVELLRNAEWLAKHGHTSSIMDYARFNYVAQPVDSIPADLLMPRIGDYDKWAIQWGYSRLPGDKTSEEEKEQLYKIAVDSLRNNPRLWFGGEGRDHDPRSQAEDLGDNAILASNYGIENLQRILPYLKKWTTNKASDDYSNLEQLYQEAQNQFKRYLFHVAKNIGGIYSTPKMVGEFGNVYAPVPKEIQKEALTFLEQHLFNEPRWLVNAGILNKIDSPVSKRPTLSIMESAMISLMGGDRISRMGFIAERFTGQETYAPEEYLQDLKNLIWKDFEDLDQITPYRRSLQKAHITNLASLYKPKKAPGLSGLLALFSEDVTENTDVRSLALSQLMQIHQELLRAIPKAPDTLTRAHFHYLVKEIEGIVKGNVYQSETITTGEDLFHGTEYDPQE